jgi:ubiquinone/menaquinone biosynthesis C-methylase UbiE/uncharacterized protein YbaR (Trm112 family)
MLDMTAFLVCPVCRNGLTRDSTDFLCPVDGRRYPLWEGVPQFDLPAAPEATQGRDERRTYWDLGWEARFQRDHAFLTDLKTRSDWEKYLQGEERRLSTYGHVSVVEASRPFIEGKVLLDIGCGSGGSGALFAYRGAKYIGIDHSGNAARYALRHLRAVEGIGFTVQGNAEALPLRSDSIDVVYSNGVLHHTPNITTAMDEVYRVLKPGGRAIIALYATYSTQFGVMRLLGLMKGHFSRESMEQWMGNASEGDWRTGDRVNPWTETFSVRKMKNLVRKYPVKELAMRKQGQPIGEFPRFGPRLMRRSLLRKLDQALSPLLGGMLIMSFRK